MNAIHHPKGRKGHVTSGEFTRAMGAAATGVTVVTTEGVAGRYGLTVSAIASVSAEPPLLLVCVNRRNPCVSAMTQNGRFAVNILSEAQEEVARMFSGKPVSGTAYDFTHHGWELGEHGMPLLTEAAAHFECEVDTIHDAGTHRIFIGRVIAALRGETPPLLYSNRSYGRLSALDDGPHHATRKPKD